MKLALLWVSRLVQRIGLLLELVLVRALGLVQVMVQVKEQV
jgi:hypothetical protein